MDDTVVLGISLCENASATLLKNGKIISHILRERISGIKNHYGMDFSTVQLCLAEAKCDVREVSYCALTATPQWPALIEDINQFYVTESVSNHPYFFLSEINSPVISARYQNENLSRFIRNEMKPFVDFSSIRNKEWELIKFSNFLTKNFCSNDSTIAETGLPGKESDLLECPLFRPIMVALGEFKIPGFLVYHHLAYASSSYYSSSFFNSLIFTHDSSSSKDSGLFFEGEGCSVKPLIAHNLECLRFYKYASQRCNLKCSDSAASKLMTLSSSGKGFLNNILPIGSSAAWEHTDFKSDFLYDRMFNGLIEKAPIKNIYPDQVSLKKTCFPNLIKEVACAVQQHTERTVITKLRGFKKVFKDIANSNLCLSGPIALNCYLNSALWRLKIFQNIHISPCCDETGLSIGAAQYLYYSILGNTREKPLQSFNRQSVMLGRRHPQKEIFRTLKKFSSQISFKKEKAWTQSLANDLFKNYIVAVFYGRSEGCSRALGHRSILANPAIEENIKRMGLIKRKNKWAPYASIILQDYVSGWLEDGPKSSPFLHFVYKLKKDKKYLVPGVLHIDGTTRAQIVSKEDQELYEILKRFQVLQGIPIVMKSSFNKAGNPIVESPQEAIRIFLDTSLDILYLSGYRIQKKVNY